MVRCAHPLSLALLTLAAGSPAQAVTALSVDGHPSPVTIAVGETVTIRYQGKPNRSSEITILRDLARNGHANPLAPYAGDYTFQNGSTGKVAAKLHLGPSMPAGPYVLEVRDGDIIPQPADLPITLVPQPAPQGISGRVAVITAADPAGAPPPDAIVWAYTDSQTPAASADVQPDGSYTLPLAPGTYLLTAEWYGSLRSQRQVVTVAAGQSPANINIPLVYGQEVSGMVRDDHGQPLANAPVQVTASGGATFTTQSFTDGSYLLALPPGQYTLSARGSSQAVTVADEPLDEVDLPAPAIAPAPAVGTVITVAGDGIPGLGSDGRPATAARLLAPLGLAVDRPCNLYIADAGAYRIRKVDGRTGLISTMAGSTSLELLPGLQLPLRPARQIGDGGPATEAELDEPQDVAVDGSGNLYISDYANHRVRKVDANGIITTVAGNGQYGSSGDGHAATAAALAFPSGLVVDAAGDLFITENLTDRVRRVSPDGAITTVAGGGNAKVTNGASATAIALFDPFELAVDATGNLLIGDSGLNQILKVTPGGKISIVAGTGQARFSADGGLATKTPIEGRLAMAVDSAGDLFFADLNRIRKIGPDGIVTTVAGNGHERSGGGFMGDGGPATAARLTGPTSLAIDAAGNLFFTDGQPGAPSDQSVKRIREVIGIAAPGLVGGQ